MSAVGIIWAAALPVISFLAANAYTACLLSLSGNPISNLIAALTHLPSYVVSAGPYDLPRGPGTAGDQACAQGENAKPGGLEFSEGPGRCSVLLKSFRGPCRRARFSARVRS